MIRRREFITLRAAAAWPLAARGQPTSTFEEIGGLNSGNTWRLTRQPVGRAT
jgi:hypothetical protein